MKTHQTRRAGVLVLSLVSTTFVAYALMPTTTDDEDGAVASTSLTTPLNRAGGPREINVPDRGLDAAPSVAPWAAASLRLGTLKPSHAETDIRIPSTFGTFALTRRYVRDDGFWRVGQSIVSNSPPHAFGTAQGSSSAIHWSHNLFSYVAYFSYQYAPSEVPAYFRVRDLEGRIYEFIPNSDHPSTVSEWLPPSPGTDPHVGLFWDKDNAEFTFVQAGARLRFKALYKSGTRAWIYFITAIETTQYQTTETTPSPGTVARISYALPGCYAKPTSVTTDGAPFVSSVRIGAPRHPSIPDTVYQSKLDFIYEAVGTNCLLRRLQLEDRATSPATVADVVLYEYDTTGTTPFFKEAKFKVGNTWTVSKFAYLDGTSPVFRRANDIGNIETQYLDGGAVAAIVSDAPTKSISAYTAAGSSCAPGVFTGTCPADQWQVVSATTQLGNGTSSDTFVEEGRLVVQRDSDLVVEKQFLHTTGNTAWLTPGVSNEAQWNTALLSNGDRVTVSQKDSAGNSRVYTRTPSSNARFTGARSPPTELTQVRAGATNSGGDNALDTTWFSYEYGGLVTTPALSAPDTDDQLLKEMKKASVLGASGTFATTTNVYDTATNRLKATIRSGYTRTLDNPSANLLRHVGVFYYTNQQCEGSTTEDPYGRTVEVHGPCFVSGVNATVCATGQPVPVTRYIYWPLNVTHPNNQNNLGRLVTTKVFTQAAPNCAFGSTATSLDTTYSYDAYGRVISTVDPNAVVSTYVYEGQRLKTVTTNGATTEYGYDVADPARVAWIKHPEGNYDVFSYKDSTGAFSNLLQWRASAADSAGSDFVEKVSYSYRGGVLETETFLDSTGARAS